MKRKLRIVGNIAIICLSVCMFAFGVYAASTVSVTTNGTVVFNATDVYANVTRTIENIADTSVYKNIDVTYNADTVDKHSDLFDKESLIFDSADKDIVMTFTITNLATEENRYLYATFTETESESKNVTKLASSIGGEIAIAPGESKDIKVYMRVTDPNLSANAGYNYTLNLSNITTAVTLDETLATYEENETGLTLTGLKATSAASVSTLSSPVAMADTIDPATLTNIIIPATIGDAPVTAIGSSAFASNTVLQNITIPDSVTTIGESSFLKCSNLVIVNTNKRSQLASVGSRSFQECSKLNYFNFTEKLLTINSYAFAKTSLIAVDIPYGVTEIALAAFAFSNIEYITIPETVRIIGLAAFQDCSRLREFIMPKSIETISEQAFIRCTNLKKIVLQDVSHSSTVSVSMAAFAFCGFTDELYIPNAYILSGTSNGQFYGTPITSFTVNDDNPRYIVIDSVVYKKNSSGKPTFLEAYPNGSKNEKLILPATVTGLRKYELEETAPNLAYIEVEEGNATYSSAGGILYNKSGTSIIVVPMNFSTKVYDIKEGITTITHGMISKGAYEIYLPSTATTIAECVFQMCKDLKKIGLIGQNVESGTFDFSQLSRLKSMSYKALEESISMKVLKVGSAFTSFGDGCFMNAVNLEEIYIYNETSVVSVTYYEYAATALDNFKNLTKLSAIYVPSDLVDDYKESKYWSCVADKIQALPVC